MSQALKQVENAENSINDAVREIVLIEPKDAEQGRAKYDALEFLRLFRENQLKELRDAFE